MNKIATAVQLLQLIMQLEPALATLIQLSNSAEITPEQFASLQAQRDKAIADYEAAIGKKDA